MTKRLTGAQVYKRFMRGESFYAIGCGTPWIENEVADMMRAYLIRRDKRRKAE